MIVTELFIFLSVLFFARYISLILKKKVADWLVAMAASWLQPRVSAKGESKMRASQIIL